MFGKRDTMNFMVTAKHIAQGQRENHLRNPIALAAQELDRFAVVTKTKIHTRDRIYSLPEVARQVLHIWDRGGIIQPFNVIALY